MGIRFLTWVVAPLSVIYSLKPHIPTHLKSLQRPDWANLSHLGPKFKKIIEAVTILENVLLSHIYILILIIYFCLKLQIWPVLFLHMVLSGHVESSSPETSCDSQSVLWAHSGAFTAQSSTKQLLIYPFFPFPHLLSVSTDFDCSDPLGMESGEIASDQIMASSQYNPSWSPERSRLNYYENAWTPAEDSNKEWIQVAC